LALGTGPGSYTGIRLAIAIAQGLHLGTDLPVFAVNSFDVLLLDCPFQDGWLVADAQRQEFAVSKVLRGQRDSNLTLHPLSELQTWLQDGHSVAGPDLPTSLPGHLPLYPQAGNLGRWVARNSPLPIAPEHLHPCYLRPIAFVKAIPPTQ
jgi:tRNA threonylcarbamoyladenosine biosynthesis protein TsaB